MHLCEVANLRVFIINKDVYVRELVLIDVISKDDVAPSPQRLVTLIEEPLPEEVEDVEGGKEVGPRD